MRMMRRVGAGLVTLMGMLCGQEAPGLLVTATDGARTATYVAATPNLHLTGAESIHPALRPSFQAEFSGFLTVLRAGEYEFEPGIVLDGKVGTRFSLTGGKHPLLLRYKRPDGLALVRLRWKSGEFDWEPVPPSLFTHRPSPLPVEEGRTLVEQSGCASCHTAPGLSRPAPALAPGVSPAWVHTWLAKPQPHMPLLLSDRQRADVTAYLASLGPTADPKVKNPNEVEVGKGGELFGTLGCLACHQLSGLGSKYTYPALFRFLKSTHRPSMMLEDEEVVALAGFLARSTDPAFEQKAPPGDASAGAKTVQTAGCLACHTLPGSRNLQTAKPLAQLGSAFCTVARYDFTPPQSAAIAAFLKSGPDQSPAPVYQLPRRLAELRCVSCHGTGTEAPPLAGVGEKLKSSWIEKVLWGKQRIRTGREMRMPHYEQQDVADLVPAFAKAEGLEPGDGAAPPLFTADRRTRGHGLLGTNAKTQGMSCIGCHDWGEYKSLGEEGPQLINATERMRWDWFARWMHNPARILSGTSMPNYFTSTRGRERAAEVIGSLWAAMELGAKGPIPDGYRVADLGQDAESKPVPGKDAIVVRWDMPEATPAAIAVGLPGQLSYCFDAGRAQVLYAWSGGFVDMSGTLLKKTDKNKLTPTAALVGEVFYRSREFPIRVGRQDREPTARFRGYRLLENGIPEFYYSVDGINIREKLVPLAAERAILRQFTFEQIYQPVWLEGRLVPQGASVKAETRITK